MLKIRVSFVLLLLLVAVTGTWIRSSEPATAVPLAAAVAAVFAALAILAEVSFTRAFEQYLSPIIYGSLLGWAAGLAATELLSMLPAWLQSVDPFRRSVLMLAFVYVGALGAVRAEAAGVQVLRLRLSRRQSAGGSGGRAAMAIHAAALVFVGGCLAYLWLAESSSAGRVDLLLLAAGSVVVCAADAILGRRLPQALAVALPAILFAVVLTAETFTIISAGAALNFHISLEMQQLALFIIWLYVGTAFMQSAVAAGRHTFLG